MPRNLTIACDVDGVVADLYTEWLRRYNADFDDTLTPAQCTSWSLHEFVKPECGRRIYEYLDEPNLYDDVQPMSDAWTGINELRWAGHRVVFVTSTPNKSAGRKFRWLKQHGFLPDHFSAANDYIEARDKSLIRADVMIDDAPHNLERFCGLRILYPQPHNKVSEVLAFNALDWLSVVSLVAAEAK